MTDNAYFSFFLGGVLRMNKKSGLSMHNFLILLSMIPLVVSLLVLTLQHFLHEG